MRQLKSLFIAVALIFGTIQIVNAQKIAHINMQQLVENHPEMEKAKKVLQDMANQYEKEYQGMINEYQTKQQKYISEEETVTETLNKERAVELQNMSKSIQDFGSSAQKTMSDKELELIKPISEKVTSAVQKVGRDKGYEFVLDSSIGSGIILADGYDLLNDVKKELGI